MPILSNTPTIRYITIQNLVVKDTNVYYPIVTTETSKKYIYWDKDSPYELICTDEMLKDRANLYLLILNKKGNFTIVNQDSISVNFGNDVDLDGFSGKLNSTIEKVDEHTKKFASVVEDINGINKTVGTITEDLNETNEKLTNYKQTSDQIAIDVQNINKKYNEDKELNKLRETIVDLLIDENGLLTELNVTIKDITRDNNFTNEEKTKVKEIQSKITNKNDLLMIEVDKLVSMLEKEDLTDKKNQLISIKEEYISSFNLLGSTLTSLVSGNTITPSQITILINCISSVSTKLTKLKNICDEVIFLGTGGTLYEEIVKINITAGGIYSKVSSIEENIKSNLSLEKGILNQHIKDLQVPVDKIETVIREIYLDGIVNQTEKDLVSQVLQSIKVEHEDLIGKYNEYLMNEHLSKEMKTKLQNVHSNYINSYDSFVNELNTVISDGFFNEKEKTNVDLKLEDYKKNITIFHNNLSLAIDDYEQNRYKNEIDVHKNQLQGQISKVQEDLSSLTENIEGTFKDNIIDESERNAIKQSIKNLDIQKANIDSQYNQLYKNALLTDPLKTQFLDVYNDFNNSYNTLLNTLNEILNKKTLITQQDKINMDKCYADLVLKTTDYTTVANKVVEFIANAEAEQSAESFQNEIDDLQKQIDGIDVNINGAFADNLLDMAERELIKSKLEIINTNKIDVDSQYNKLYNSPNLKDTNLKAQFKQKYDAFIEGYNKFSSIANSLLEKQDVITEEEKKQLNDSISSLNILLGEFTTCSLDVAESIYDTQAQNKVADINGDISDLTNRMDNVVETVGNALTDGILDKAEKTSIEQGLLNLQTQKVEIDNEYNQLYENVNLDELSKSQLKKSYDAFILKYNALIDSINVMLTKDGVITEIERNNYTTAYEDYKTYLATFTQSLYEANNKVYNTITENAKGELSKEIGKVSQSISDLNDLMNGAFYDGILSEAEKISLKSNLDLLKVEKIDVDNQYNQTYNNPNLNSNNKLNLKTAYNDYTVAYDALIKFIETLISSTDIVNESHKKQLESLLKSHNDKLGLYVIQYNLAIENISKSYSDAAKNELQQQITGVSNSVADLENNMNGVFQDSILTEAEKLAIKERLQNLQVEKINIENQYNTLIMNPDLVDEDSINTPKTNLRIAYNNLLDSYYNLVDAINTLINVDGILDDSHRIPVNNAFTDYKNRLGTYSTRVNEAVDAISKKRVDDEANIRKEQYAQINQTVNEISIKVASIERTTNSTLDKVAEISTSLDGIVQRVESTETKVIITNDKIANLETWKSEAEQKITETAITNTVRKNFYTKDETEDAITSKGYQTASQVQQTVDGLEIKVSQSGGYNLIPNSTGASWNTNGWTHDGVSMGVGSSDTIGSNCRTYMYLDGGTSTYQRYAYSTRFKLKPNSKYILSGYFNNYDGCSGFKVYLLSSTDLSDTDTSMSYTNIQSLIYDQNTYGSWKKFTGVITTPSNTKSGYIRIDNNGYNSYGYGENKIHWNALILAEGEIEVPWTPAPNEIYSGITSIDKDGVKVEMVEGEYGSSGYSTLSYEGISTFDAYGNTKSWFGTNDSAYIQNLTVDDIENPYIIQCKPRVTSWYVGLTSTGDGSGVNMSNKANSIQSVLEKIRKDYGSYIYKQDLCIYCDNGVNLNENIHISGWLGTGVIRIYFGKDSTYTGYIKVEECTPAVMLEGDGTSFNVNDGCQWYRTDGNTDNVALYVRRSTVVCRNFRAHRGAGYSSYGNVFAVSDSGSSVVLSNNDLVKYYAIARSTAGGITYINKTRGDVSLFSEGSNDGTIINYAELPIFDEGKKSSFCYNSHIIAEGTDGQNSLWMPKDFPTTPPTPNKSWHWVEKTFYFKLSSTTEGSGSATSAMSGAWGQGKWGSYKAHRGHAKPTESISGWCNVGSNTRNISMTLTMTRLNTNHGYSGAVPKPKLKQPDNTYWNSNVAYARGDTKSITLPYTIVSGLSSGSLSELTMWAGTSTEDYSKYNTVSLKVMCEKYY